MTDCWIGPNSWWRRVPGTRRIRDRHHASLDDATVADFSAILLACESWWRMRRRSGWPLMLARNAVFQNLVVRELEHRFAHDHRPRVLFAYSYAALEPIRWAKRRGWRTVLGQIDPGPEEERIVVAAQAQCQELGSKWSPPPSRYWDDWREEVAAADTVVVNSTWSHDCLVKEGVEPKKLRTIPLAFDPEPTERVTRQTPRDVAHHGPLECLFLGQIVPRKGVVTLLQAMHHLRDAPVRLTLAGPSDFPPSAWQDLPNVRWIGRVPRSSVTALLSDADVFVLPTLSDGFAITQLEAMAQGLPIITTLRCGNVVRNGVDGWIVPVDDPSALAATIRRVANNRESLRHASTQARLRARDFSLARVGTAWLDVCALERLHSHEAP
jgi:glycosyltransferase involved in cell wall biosynthesis